MSKDPRILELAGTITEKSDELQGYGESASTRYFVKVNRTVFEGAGLHARVRKGQEVIVTVVLGPDPPGYLAFKPDLGGVPAWVTDVRHVALSAAQQRDHLESQVRQHLMDEACAALRNFGVEARISDGHPFPNSAGRRLSPYLDRDRSGTYTLVRMLSWFLEYVMLGLGLAYYAGLSASVHRFGSGEIVSSLGAGNTAPLEMEWSRNGEDPISQGPQLVCR